MLLLNKDICGWNTFPEQIVILFSWSFYITRVWKQYFTISSLFKCKFTHIYFPLTRSSCSWLYGSWIYNYICNQCLSPLKLFESRPCRGTLDTASCDKVCQWLATGRWFSPGTPVSSTNKTDRHDITEILLTVALNTITNTQQTHIGKMISKDKINVDCILKTLSDIVF